MFLAKVIGNVVCTQKDQSLVGSKLLIIHPIQIISGREKSPIIAVDTIGAGVGETVLVTTGSSARMASANEGVADAAIVGIVDSMEVHN